MDYSAIMQRCLMLAELGAGNVAPNPMVGCMILYEDKIIAEGFHKQFGGPHAEVDAIQNAIAAGFDDFSEATLIVNFEPCSHHGKTPPCADLVIEKKFKKVVIASVDPNPLVAGRGIKKLKDSGIKVITGISDAENKKSNAHFFIFQTKQRPYITLKWAQSSDGFIAKMNHEQIKLSNKFSDVLVHKMRAEHMAILVGGRTAVKDNPLLNVRLWTGKSPLRIVLDNKGFVPKNLHVLDNSIPTLIFNPLVEGKKANTEFIKCIGKNTIQQVLQYLYTQNINSLLVEGGAITLNDFINSGAWDAIKIFETPHILYSGIAAPIRPELPSLKEKILDNNLVSYYNV
ncbi:MAG: bifunctional diaminohydroxyphosphoribosylaminopyrimidine deaminase/5-amino-6-(5-phosphoribosylamino)uracil reductase RibD [Bacteroidetes bacterium]|nr:bifunctional diaminohydroxyphosphoribosylaminopyrimidine deaminase/5-amino-6-(5-phosphoribosylamino)uracil reductase RibD [Bacteroidota bacterium]MBP7399636.1 bifunctional diaminohydroxyphosphoribosylaminopyrimidine deaminase/5-amino-6-(5-phosphoribosylamino)uracil reductase RibD [Chitinophagales bacterium]MBK8488431.1 bifunctional diaminohydroxyphosphoribosylaminopyrimidine deaminase/5-amino-6-(5-phosphoribosylamino)uracil reductase RibD [Bacteroidota bacterium]MBK8681806.1 bifunctional diam